LREKLPQITVSPACISLAQVSLLLLILFCPPFVSAQQHSAKSLSYGFVSPNTREGLKLDDAIQGLASTEEETLIRSARTLGCVAQTNIEAYKVVGSWSDGAEHSVMLRAKTDTPTMRYVISLLGRSRQQKAVLYFRSDPTGTAEMYILRPRGQVGPIRRVSQALDEAGIQFRTLVPTKTTIMVYVVDLNRELQTKISAAAKKLKARLTSQRGLAGFIGDDSSREKGQTIFSEEITRYESANAALISHCRSIGKP
jgi:hypothetical protein